jgi:hypothetical protein
VRSFQLALGEQEGEMEMHQHEQHTPSSSLLAATHTCHRLYPQTQAERMTCIRLSTLDIVLENALIVCEKHMRHDMFFTDDESFDGHG